MSDGATVCITRRWAFTNALWKFKVLVDEVEVGRVGNGETARFPIAPGRHAIRLALQLYSSKPCIVDAQPGETVRFVCGQKGWVSGMLSVFTSPGDYLQLEPDGTAREAIAIDPSVPVAPASSDQVSVHLEDAEERVPAARETVMVPRGVTVKVKRARTVEHTVEVDWSVTGELRVEAGFKQLLSGSIRGEISRKQGRSATESESMEYEVELKGETCEQYQLSWSDIWRKGIVEFQHKGRTLFAPLRFRERAELDVVPLATRG